MRTVSANTLTLMAGGDVGPIIEPVDQVAELILPLLRQADFRIAQCERTYSERGWYQEWHTIPGGRHARQNPKLASIFQKAGIDVISLASNHAMDWGYEPLFDTIDYFRSIGKQIIGAGRSGEEAHRPAIIEKNGVKVAILAYCSVLRDGQAAVGDKPGICPMRARTVYEPIDFQPGSPPNIITTPFDEDMELMRQDIAKAKAQADAVAIFIHFGIRWVPKIVATYQPPVAHAAIDAGADIIIGHHAHCPKGIEVYKGKVCFYSIGNFLTTGQNRRALPSETLAGAQDPKHLPIEWNLYWFKEDPDSLYRFPIHCKHTILPKITFSKQGVQRVAFTPAYINKLAQPEPLTAGQRFEEALLNMEDVSDYLPHKFRVEGNEVVVEV